MIKRLALIIYGTVAMVWPQYPGMPLKNYGPAKMALGLFYDHNGQDLFEKSQSAASVLNNFGIHLGYAPWKWLKLGASLSGSEFDHNKPKDVSEGYAFDSDHELGAGAVMSIQSPEWYNKLISLYGYGCADAAKAADDYGNKREFLLFRAGAGFQWRYGSLIRFAVGTGWHYMTGNQKNDSASAVFGSRHPIRAAVLLELYPKTNKNLMSSRPFVNFGFKFSEKTGFDGNLGLSNASFSVTVGLITGFLYGKFKEGAEEDFN